MKKVNKVNAVLIELIIVVLFFAISSIITIRLFAKSYSLTASSSAKMELAAVVEMQMNDYRNKTVGEGDRVLFFDEKLKPCEEEDAYYIEKIHASNDSEMPLINVEVNVIDENNKTVLSFVTAFERQVQ